MCDVSWRCCVLAAPQSQSQHTCFHTWDVYGVPLTGFCISCQLNEQMCEPVFLTLSCQGDVSLYSNAKYNNKYDVVPLGSMCQCTMWLHLFLRCTYLLHKKKVFLCRSSTKQKLCLLMLVTVSLLSVCTAEFGLTQIIPFLVQMVGLLLPTATGMVAVINPEKIREIRPGDSGSKHNFLWWKWSKTTAVLVGQCGSCSCEVTHTFIYPLEAKLL